jgi:cysteinyl-tRNA synthetase
MNKIFLFDSSKKHKLEFISQKEKQAKIYICGPTVYDDSHLGHARSAIVFDLLHRVLKANDYNVIIVKNFTDVDDKIINKMQQTNQTLKEITELYINSYKDDMNNLNILPNTIEPKATDNIDSMKKLINNLLQKDYAYILEDGVYFDTSKDEKYGDISHKISDESSQARAQINQAKRDFKDFALWKFKNDEVSFEASFGIGRPGWHCECSAMIDEHLSDKSLPYAIDIHCGGADLLFPHHENEATQTRLAYNQELAKYWMHNGFVNINGCKMSKSLGNSFLLKDALKLYNGEVVRFYMLSTHYKADFSFSTIDLDVSKKRLDKLYRLKKRVYGISGSTVNKQLKQDIILALNDDMNTSIALSIIDEYVSTMNDILDNEPKNKSLKKELISNIDFINEILGIGYQDSFKYFQFGVSQKDIINIENLIIKRNEAKKDKNYELSDKIRDKLKEKNVSIMDTLNGTLWEKLINIKSVK